MNIQEKALQVIEFIALDSGETRQDDETMSLIYRISHVANGDCKNPHEDWLKELDDIYNDLEEIYSDLYYTEQESEQK